MHSPVEQPQTTSQREEVALASRAVWRTCPLNRPQFEFGCTEYSTYPQDDLVQKGTFTLEEVQPRKSDAYLSHMTFVP
jgi:hypothetical protein